MKVKVKNKNAVYDLQPILIGKVKYTRTAPIFHDLYEKEIEVKLSKYPQYDFECEDGWNWCKEWLEDIE